MKQEFYPTDMESDMRIDKYLSESCPELSRSYIQKLLKSGQVLVNKKGVKASYVVSEDDHIELEVPAAVEPEIEAEAMDLDILYEDQDIILINKPKGMVVHPAAGHYSHTLVNGLMYHCKDQLSGINGVMRPGIVHRIDMDTTGVLKMCIRDRYCCDCCRPVRSSGSTHISAAESVYLSCDHGDDTGNCICQRHQL